MGKFEDLYFKDKEQVKANCVKQVRDHLDVKLNCESLSELAILRYLDVLIDDQENNFKDKCFYDRSTNCKLTYSLLASIARDYIIEHLEDLKIM